MPRKPVVLLCVAVAAVCVGCGKGDSTAEPARRKPSPQATFPGANVILISVDTLRADRLNCYGYDRRTTSPNIDALARDGVTFEQFITSSPWTTPAHMSMLTGLFPSTHGVNMAFREVFKERDGTKRYYRLARERTTLAELLRDKGYETAAFTSGGTMDPSFGFDQGFDSYDTSMYKLNETNMGRMFQWVRDHADGRFFLFWHNFEVHAPYLQPEFVGDVLTPEVAQIVQEETREIAAIRLDEIWPRAPRIQRSKQRKLLRRHEAFDMQTCDALYTGGVRSVDRWLGRLVQLLREAGLYEDTLIVFTSDHGEELGERARRRRFYNVHGSTMYDELLRVPLIIKLPGRLHAGKRVPQLASMVDVMPTILDLLAVPHAGSEIQGGTLRRLWLDSSAGADRETFSESTSLPLEMKCVRTDRYKFMVYINAKDVERYGRNHIPAKPRKKRFFDLWEDPREKRDLLRRLHHPRIDDIAAFYEARLREWAAAQTGAAERVDLGDDTIEALKGLGYIDDTPGEEHDEEPADESAAQPSSKPQQPAGKAQAPLPAGADAQ